MSRGLDAQTAFEIVSIDIADIDVGENIGARLQSDQAEADTRVARAEAEQPPRRGDRRRATNESPGNRKPFRIGSCRSRGANGDGRSVYRRPDRVGHGHRIRRLVHPVETTSYRVSFSGGLGCKLAGIVDRPVDDELALVVVFSHCFTCNKDLKAIVRISRGLAARGIACLRFDMTGLGGSEGDFSTTHFTSNLADLTAAVDFARVELGSVDALVGHSFGGAASLAYAGQSFGRSNDPSSENADSNIRAVVALAAPSDTRHLAILLSRMNPVIESAGIGEVIIGGRTWTIRAEMLADFRDHDLPAMISKIACPTLLIHSPEDRTVGYDHALRIMGLIQSSQNAEAGNVSLLSMPKSDHLFVNDARDIELVTDSVAAFLLRYAQAGVITRAAKTKDANDAMISTELAEEPEENF